MQVFAFPDPEGGDLSTFQAGQHPSTGGLLVVGSPRDAPALQLLARTKRYLAARFLADPGRADRSQPRQSTARSNAAEACATLRKRREDRDDAEEYLESRRLSDSSPHPVNDQRGHGSEHVR